MQTLKSKAVYRERNSDRIYKKKISKYTVMFILSIILLASSALKYFSSSKFPSFVESYYSTLFYKFFTEINLFVTTKIPFSLAEILVYATAIYALILIVLTIVKTAKAKNSKFKTFLEMIVIIIFSASIILFLYTVSCVPNYYRYEFSHYSGIYPEKTSEENLELLLIELVENANLQREEIENVDENGVAIYSVSFSELSDICNKSYENLILENPKYEGVLELSTKARAKSVMSSVLMSYSKIAGIYFPYTAEANVNTNLVDTDIPATICHEFAHISGFMREDEANFISYIATRASDDSFVSYSGTLMALTHTSNAYYKINPEKHAEIMSNLSAEVKIDRLADYENYKKYDTSFGEFTNKVNDTYLKINNHSDGVKSYGKMVDLLIADYNERHK